MTHNHPFIVGLTGGIGSGKSAAADAFAALGIEVVDTDAIAHELTRANGAAMPLIVAAFGPAMRRPDGAMDRNAMRALVFEDSSARKRLETILHPLIGQLSQERCLRADSPYVILSVPLLIESERYRDRCDRICVVDCPSELQLARVMKRSGLTEEEVRAIMAAQATRDQRLAAADDVIDNSGTLAQLEARVCALDQTYRRLASAV